MTPDYHITAFWATDKPNESLAFYQGHQRVLKRHGLEAVGSASPEWLTDPNVLVLLARDAEGNPAGGIRLHRSRPGRPLPLVAALAAAHPNILPVLAPALLMGAAESCGLWVAAWHGRRGLAQLLLRYSVALAPKVAPYLYGLAAPHTVAMSQTLGFEPVRHFGQQGSVTYPTPAYLSTLMEWRPSAASPLVDTRQLARIRSLEAQPTQMCCEWAECQQVWVRYTPAFVARTLKAGVVAEQHLELAA